MTRSWCGSSWQASTRRSTSNVDGVRPADERRLVGLALVPRHVGELVRREGSDHVLLQLVRPFGSHPRDVGGDGVVGQQACEVVLYADEADLVAAARVADRS